MKKLIGFMVIIAIFFINLSVYATEVYDVEITTESKDIENSKKEVILYIELTKYSGDGLLGYEGNLEFDKNVFESVEVENINGWDKITYDEITGKIMATTSSAKEDTKIAKLTLKTKDGITEEETIVKLNNFTLSDGNDEVTLNKKITYNFNENNIKQDKKATLLKASPSLPSNTENNSNESNNDENKKNEEDTNSNIPIETTVEPASNIQENINFSTGNKKIETVSALKENDDTKAQNNIPQAGSTTVEFAIIICVSLVGMVAYIRYKTIKLK